MSAPLRLQIFVFNFLFNVFFLLFCSSRVSVLEAFDPLLNADEEGKLSNVVGFFLTRICSFILRLIVRYAKDTAANLVT